MDANLRRGVDRQFAQPLASINLFRQGLPPITAFKVPNHRTAQAAFEGFARRPVQFTLDTRTIESIAEVVTGAVRDERNESLATALVVPRKLIDNAADLPGHIDVASFGIAADEIGLADAAFRRKAPKRTHLIFDIQPVANVFAVTVDRQGLAGERFEDHHWNELFGKLK